MPEMSNEQLFMEKYLVLMKLWAFKDVLNITIVGAQLT